MDRDDSRRSTAVRRYLKTLRQPAVVGTLAELEAMNRIARNSDTMKSPSWQKLQTLPDVGHWRRRPLAWDGSGTRARTFLRPILRQFGTLRVAAAWLAGCVDFTSLDSGGR